MKPVHKRDKMSKRDRQHELSNVMKLDPFLTDEDLAVRFNVSIQTVRLDRLELGIPELRERMRFAASENYAKVRSMSGTEIIGELIDLELGKMEFLLLKLNRRWLLKKPIW